MKVRWSASARRDRATIREYVALDDRRAAARMDALFSAAAARLTQHPLLGKSGQNLDTREFIVHKHYRLVYEFDGETVWVLALVHTSRAWPPVQD